MSAFATTLDPGSVAPDGVLIPGPAATENSIVAAPASGGAALVVVNTYGFQYPAFALDSSPQPETARYEGGMTRIDVAADGSCRRVWTSLTRTASLPKLTRGDGLVHALAYGPLAGEFAPKIGPVFVTATDVRTGREVDRTVVGIGPIDEPMELTGTLVSSPVGPGTAWQPTLTRMLRISPR